MEVAETLREAGEVRRGLVAGDPTRISYVALDGTVLVDGFPTRERAAACLAFYVRQYGRGAAGEPGRGGCSRLNRERWPWIHRYSRPGLSHLGSWPAGVPVGFAGALEAGGVERLGEV
jgi:hypothetical protein